MKKWGGDLTVGLGWVYYNGPVGDTEFHQHYAVQICFPFSGPLHIETHAENQVVDDILIVGSNVSHRLSSPSPTAQLLYIEPNLIRKNTARLSVDQMVIVKLPKAQMESIQSALNIDIKKRDSNFGLQLANLIWPKGTGGEAFSPIDPRISQTLAEIEAAEDLNIRLGQVTKSTGLSASRFRHLFSAQVGMSLKSYLLWSKLQRAIQSLATNSSLTSAAHAAGFADSAHLSRTFRRTFGLSPADLNRNAHFTTRKNGL
ncbi:AraC family transcriptional regulator [Kordiimonas aquimaris]|uniref:AraC family transcriptional regulator n=1 Tax=Kordiimonas aquimaris TaxID=707591 RepID=UPI0021D25363|nr:AraC family transcriptional regulator [Kordiimonas aquimaris]